MSRRDNHESKSETEPTCKGSGYRMVTRTSTWNEGSFGFEESSTGWVACPGCDDCKDKKQPKEKK